MTDRLRTIVIALCVAPLALPVSACGGGVDDPRQKRIVCTNQAREIIHDDFAVKGSWTGAIDGTIQYESDTQNGNVNVSGQCAAYPAMRAPDWKPVIQGLAG